MTTGIWRHTSCLDVDFKILAVIPTGQAWKCSVIYVNRHLDIYHGHELNVIIQRKDFWKWSKIL